MARPEALSPEGALPLLESGEIEILGALPNASNATLLVRVRDGDAEGLAVYKPRRGEAPLWDFPRGTLCLREFAAWLVDAALGWGLVPPTVLREGPAGFGAVQAFVEADPEADPRRLLATHERQLRLVAAFDLVVNNADRKAGHLLVDRSGRLWAVDHGITFHAEPKLRTVLWAFAGEPVEEEVLAAVEQLEAQLARGGELAGRLEQLLAPREVAALRQRVRRLLAERTYPTPGPGRHVPWPPW